MAITYDGDVAAGLGEPPLVPTLLAAAGAGLGGLFVFLVIHAFLILPIWFIAVPGSVFAALGGAAVGWAYHEVRPRFRRPSSAVPALLGFQVLAVSPALAFALARGPLPPTFLTNPPDAFLLRAVAELLAGAVSLGALSCLLLAAPGRRRRAAVAGAAAAIGLAIGPGHNVPLLAAAPAAPQMWGLLFASSFTAALLFVPLCRWMRSVRQAQSVSVPSVPWR